MNVKAAVNILIVLALAAAVAFLPGGGTTSRVIIQLFGIVFLAGLAFFAYRLYREYRVPLYSLGDRNRAILYCSIGAATLAVSGTPKLWDTGAGTLLWFVMVGGAGFGVFWVSAPAGPCEGPPPAAPRLRHTLVALPPHPRVEAFTGPWKSR